MNGKSKDGTNGTGGNTEAKGPGEVQAVESFPPWDKSNPSESMRRIGSWFNDEARRMFLKNATHSELFFLYMEDGHSAMTEPTRDMDRDTFAAVFKNFIHQNEIYGVVHIAEAWMFVPRSMNEHIPNQISESDIKISGLKSEDRAEILLVNYECRDGTQNTWINPILRTKDGGVALQDPVEIGEMGSGRFGDLF